MSARGVRGPTAVAMAVTAAVLSLVLAGCAGAVVVDPAPGGDSEACRTLVASLPDRLADASRRGAEDAAGVAAWGDPAIVLRCGTQPYGPNDLQCLTVDGIDWIVAADDPESGAALFATYGRTPAVEVQVPGAYAPAPSALPELAEAIATLPQDRACR